MNPNVIEPININDLTLVLKVFKKVIKNLLRNRGRTIRRVVLSNDQEGI